MNKAMTREQAIQKIIDTILNTKPDVCENPYNGNYDYICPFCFEGIEKDEDEDVEMSDLEHDAECIWLIARNLNKDKNMTINVRVRLKTGEAVTLKVKLPDNIKNYSKDTIDDVVSDWLYENKVEYKWYRVEEESE